jgi:membrane protease YdiL (CAAX protease family)
MNFLDDFTKSRWGVFAILFISIGLGSALSYACLYGMGYSMTELADIFHSPTPTDGLALGWANAFQQVGFFLFPWFLLTKNLPKNPQEMNASKLTFIFPILWIFLSASFIEFSSAVNAEILSLFPTFENWSHAQEMASWKIQSAILANTSAAGFLQIFMLMSIVPGILEELFFRSILLRWQLLYQKPIFAILLNGFIFSAIHFQFEGFFARWILGCVLAFVYHRSGKIWTSIFVHIFNNALSIVIYHVNSSKMTFSADHWMHHPLAICISTAFFVGGWFVLYYLWRPKGISS